MIRRERIDLVRQMRASTLAVDPMLDAMCELIASEMRADAVITSLLLEREQVFVGTYGLPNNPVSLPRELGDDMLDVPYFEVLRMDEHPAMSKNQIVHGPYDTFRSVTFVPVKYQGAVVGGIGVLTRTHRTAPYSPAEMAKIFRWRDAVQTHLQFGVLIRPNV